MKSQIRKLGRTFLELRSYRILEEDWECKAGTVPYVAMRKEEDGRQTLAFVDVDIQNLDDAEGFELPEFDRKAQTAKAHLYFSEHPDIEETPVCFDILSVHIYPNRRAFMQLLRNAHNLAA